MSYRTSYHCILFILLMMTQISCVPENLVVHRQEPTIVPPGETDEEEKPVVLPSHTSELWYEFLAYRQNGSESRLADFSYAGYRFGEKDIPDVNYPVFDITDYGAIPDDGLSDRDALQAAILAAQKNGRGIGYCPAGRFDLRPEDAPNKSIIISGNNIVLRGAGSGEGGTELFMEYPNQPESENALWSCPPLINVRYVFDNDQKLSTDGNFSDRKLADITADAARGTHTVEVSNTSGLYIGKRVFLNLKNNDSELIAAELAPYEVQADWTDILNNGIQVTEYHEISKIQGNLVTFKAPILHQVEARWGWTLHEHNCNVGIGVEDIAFVGKFQENFQHHLNATHDSGFKMLGLLRQVNGWVRRCRFTDVSEALSVQKSANVSVFSCRITGNQGHSAIRSEASTRVFIGAIEDKPAQYHSTGVSKTAIGTVLWRNKTASNSCFESHSYQPRVTLLDACQGAFIPDHAGGDQASAPNHLQELVLWNYNCINGTSKFDLWSRNNRFLLPIIAGFKGRVNFDDNQVTINERQGSEVYPESLYEAQLVERLGYLPQWLQELK